MGKELAFNHLVARRTFEEADDALGYDLTKLCFEGPDDQLRLTEITQPAILTVSIAAARVLAEAGIVPSFVAGHSLGEYSAHVAAGTLSFADAVRTVRNRGKYMQEAVPVGIGAMAAILALGIEKIHEACAEAVIEFPGQVCEPANINSPGQVVISGSKQAVERAAELCKHKGAKRAVMLPVSAPSIARSCSRARPPRCRSQRPYFQCSEIPVLCNVEAVPVSDAAKSRETLIRQVTGAVQWKASMRVLIAQGATQFLEAGPGSVLTGLLPSDRQVQPCSTLKTRLHCKKPKPISQTE